MRFRIAAHLCGWPEAVKVNRKQVMEIVRDAGYKGWIAVEEDHPRRDIAEVVRDNRKFLRRLGY
ncbi:MAG: hypothetical protein FJ279_31480 [Planctomycetes bacterium]|nr:hypothetical protein [Planctomycetota bacterium]